MQFVMRQPLEPVTKSTLCQSGRFEEFMLSPVDCLFAFVCACDVERMGEGSL